jgi:hypothetical protein
MSIIVARECAFDFAFFNIVDHHSLGACFYFCLSSTILIVNAWHDVFYAMVDVLGASFLLHFLP